MSNIYEELGVNPVINAMGHRTLLGGGTPSPEVRAVMDESEEYYADMGELIDRVGERVAEMLDVEAALITSGCAAALAVGAAAIMTGQDVAKIEQIPDVSGMRHEFIIQKQLRVKYDRSMSIPGGKLVEVGNIEETTTDHIEEAIGPNTAAIHYLAPGDRLPGALPIEEVIRIGHAHNIPIIVDAAGEVYPTSLLSDYVKMGADLVAYGAKYFGSVNSSGILTGKRDLILAARMNSFIGFEDSPTRTFARPMKVDRQEVVAVYAALREWLTMNHEDRFASYENRISTIKKDLSGVPHISLRDDPEDGPTVGLKIILDTNALGKTAANVMSELRTGTPSIWVRSDSIHPDHPSPDDDAFIIGMKALQEGGEKVIIDRLKEIL